MATGIQKLLFVDTNIWLDFYRANNGALLELLEKVESIKDQVIVTHQLEAEYKANRQKVILASVKTLQEHMPKPIPTVGVLADAQAFKAVNKSIKAAKTRLDKLQAKLIKFIESPKTADPVFKACQRIFHKTDALVLTREDVHKDLRAKIRDRAHRRFMHGSPPRKHDDTSMGDAINWEWMVQCAIDQTAELVIVSRDTDYGVAYGKNIYVNDHLRQEFSDRVSQKRKLLLYSKLSDALGHFSVNVSPASAAAEAQLLEQPTPVVLPSAVELHGESIVGVSATATMAPAKKTAAKKPAAKKAPAKKAGRPFDGA